MTTNVAVSFGVFDFFHLGHQRLINEIIRNEHQLIIINIVSDKSSFYDKGKITYNKELNRKKTIYNYLQNKNIKFEINIVSYEKYHIDNVLKILSKYGKDNITFYFSDEKKERGHYSYFLKKNKYNYKIIPYTNYISTSKIKLKRMNIGKYYILKYGKNMFSMFDKIGIHPNIITILGFICGITSIINNNNIYKSLLYLLRYVLDCLDGSYARYSNKYSRFGDYLDHFCDWTVNILFFLQITKYIRGKKYKLCYFAYNLIFIYHIQKYLDLKFKIQKGGEMFNKLPQIISHNTNYTAVQYLNPFTFALCNTILLNIIMN